MDYQHTATTEGITSPVSAVMSVQERARNFSDATSTLTGNVSGAYNANLLTQSLGWPVVQGEPYYTPGCNNPSECVLPNATIPPTAFSPVAANLLKYIPQPNIGSNLFETSNYPQTVRDDKAGGRIDANSRLGQINGYYFVDNYSLDSYNYLTPAPPLLAAAFINAGNGTQNVDPYPFTFPPHGLSQTNPDTTANWANVVDSANPYWSVANKTPYTENYMFSIQRQIKGKSLLTVSYAGNQGHRLLANVSTNPGVPSLCLSLSKSSLVAPGSETCGSYGEGGTYTSASGVTYVGTRAPRGSDYGSVTAQETIANSNYNALEATLRYTPTGNSVVLLSYTFAKSIDQGSNLGEELNPFNYRLTRAISSWDMRHNFVATYRYGIPFDRFFRPGRATQGWSIAGTTRLSTGMPVTLYDESDNSLLGTLGNGFNNYILDVPNVANGPLEINTNPRNGRPEFNASLFSEENLGQLGNADRRFFYGPGIENFDVQLTKTTKLTENTSIDIRAEAFNVFNHAQFYGPLAVDGTYGTPNFGDVVSAAQPRLIQLAVKLHFCAVGGRRDSAVYRRKGASVRISRER